LGKRAIKSEEVIADIRSGISDLELAEKYNLSPPGLESLLGHLVDSGLLSQGELEDREQFTASQVIRAFVESRRDRKVLN